MTRPSQAGLISLLAMLPLAAIALLSPGVSAAQAPGADVCKNCHEERVASYLLTKHSVKADARTPAARGGCVVCHGDGTEHVKAGGGRGVGGIKNPGGSSMSSNDTNALCLTCHQGGKRMEWSLSKHANRDTTCVSCHQVHNSHDPVRAKVTQAPVCMTCHQDKRAIINRPYRHPIEEGKVACSDCHNPHGSAGPVMMVKDSINDTCYLCHMDKRGPFVRTHQPVQENCAICHNPHGTTYPALLKIRQPFLCQSCHQFSSHRTSPAELTGSGRGANFAARGCENCHTNIHGSNAPNSATGDTGRGRAFRR